MTDTAPLDLDALAESSPTPEPAGVARREVVGDHVDIRRRRAGREIHTADRRRRIVALRQAGHTFGEIGHDLGITGEAARKQYRAAIRDVYAGDAGEALELELSRCDAMVRRWWPVMEADDAAAAGLATKHLLAAGRLRADLIGLIPPKVAAVARGIAVPDSGEVWRQLRTLNVTSEAPR